MAADGCKVFTRHFHAHGGQACLHGGPGVAAHWLVHGDYVHRLQPHLLDVFCSHTRFHEGQVGRAEGVFVAGRTCNLIRGGGGHDQRHLALVSHRHDGKRLARGAIAKQYAHAAGEQLVGLLYRGLGLGFAVFPQSFDWFAQYLATLFDCEICAFLHAGAQQSIGTTQRYDTANDKSVFGRLSMDSLLAEKYCRTDKGARERNCKFHLCLLVFRFSHRNGGRTCEGGKANISVPFQFDTRDFPTPEFNPYCQKIRNACQLSACSTMFRAGRQIAARTPL